MEKLRKLDSKDYFLFFLIRSTFAMWIQCRVYVKFVMPMNKKIIVDNYFAVRQIVSILRLMFARLPPEYKRVFSIIV